MLNLQELEKIGLECGFTHVAPLKVSTIDLLPEVRDMCKANTCHMYGKNWCCPPGVGTLEQCRERLEKYENGILVQTVGQLEDALDGEGMMETEAAHKEHFDNMRERLLARYPKMLSIGSGCCTRCSRCTYPDAPCRFPDMLSYPMEGLGMIVSEVCIDNGLKYNYGAGTLTYTGCVLID